MKQRRSIFLVKQFFAWLRQQRTIIDWGLLLGVISLIYALTESWKQDEQHREVIKYLIQVIERGPEIVPKPETYRGTTAKNTNQPYYQPLKDSKGHPLVVFSSVSQVSERGAGRLLVRGRLPKVSEGDRRWWIGIQSGPLIWPEIELLKKQLVGGREFEYSVTDRSGTKSGAIVLLEVGPRAQALFTSDLVGGLRESGLYLEHLEDVRIRASVNYQIK